MSIPMPNRFMMVEAGPDVPNVVNTIVEIPKGRRSKFEVDKKTGLLKLDRYLYSSMRYPGDYGFIPQTLAEDGDPLDILVMVNEETFSGCLIEARPIGLFRMTDRGENDFKVLAVPHSDPIFADFNDLWRVPPHFLREVEHFFATYKQLEEQSVQTLGWESADQARQEILACQKRYRDQLPAATVKTHAKPATKSKPKATKATPQITPRPVSKSKAARKGKAGAVRRKEMPSSGDR